MFGRNRSCGPSLRGSASVRWSGEQWNISRSARRYHEEAGRRIEAFLRDCRHCLEATAPAAETLDSRIDAAEVLRREGLRLLGEGEGAKLDDPARIRLSRAADERERVREAVDALGAEVQGLRSRAFVELSRSVARQGLEAHPDPVDLPAWGALRDRAEALRGEAGLAGGWLRSGSATSCTSTRPMAGSPSAAS